MQTQIHVGEFDLTGFVIFQGEEVHIERIEPDLDFWSDICLQAEKCHDECVTPELVARFFTKIHSIQDVNKQPVKRHKYSDGSTSTNVNSSNPFAAGHCICKAKMPGKMIAYDNANCSRDMSVWLVRSNMDYS